MIAKRHGNWFAPLEKYSGITTKTGQDVVTLFAPELVQGAIAFIDVIGIGASAYDIAKEQGLDVRAINWAERSTTTDKSGKLKFINKRAEQCWKFREALDPDSGRQIALPNDQELLGDLCALRWRMQSNGVKIDSKDEIRKRIGRSPDSGDAVIMALASETRTYVGVMRSRLKKVSCPRPTPDWWILPETM